MGEQIFNKMKKTVAILMAVFFIATLAAVSASAQPYPAFRGPGGHPNMRWDGHNMWDDDHNWRWDGHNWYDNSHNWRWDGRYWRDDNHHWRWDGHRWWDDKHNWWDGNKWRR